MREKEETPLPFPLLPFPHLPIPREDGKKGRATLVPAAAGEGTITFPAPPTQKPQKVEQSAAPWDIHDFNKKKRKKREKKRGKQRSS